jgi:BirA family biotin operon repressor/biotin-[acetyl-CoA-carboxylase] ligase
MLARKGAPHGSVVVAERQTSGKGRWSRRWESDEGGLYLSLVLRPEKGYERDVPLLPFLASVASAEALERAASIAVRLRWPNDLYVTGNKLGGVLCESSFTGSRLDFAVVGIGINVNQRRDDFPPEVRSRATSVRELLGQTRDVLEIGAELVRALESWWEGPRETPVLERWQELAWGAEGSSVRVVSANGEVFEAMTEGIAPDGALRVRLGDGAKRVLYSGDVQLLDSR